MYMYIYVIGIYYTFDFLYVFFNHAVKKLDINESKIIKKKSASFELSVSKATGRF